MIDALFSQSSYMVSKKMLDVTALRNEAIASNIANLETPGYKRLDVAPSFQTELKQAVESQNTSRIGSLQPQLTVDSSVTSGNRDGNTVQLESELMNLSQNTLAHTLETQLVSSSLMRLQSAISGRVA